MTAYSLERLISANIFDFRICRKLFRSNDDFIFHKRTDCSRLHQREVAAASAIDELEVDNNCVKGARMGELLPRLWSSSIEGANDTIMTPNDASASPAANRNENWIKIGAIIVL